MKLLSRLAGVLEKVEKLLYSLVDMLVTTAHGWVLGVSRVELLYSLVSMLATTAHG